VPYVLSPHGTGPRIERRRLAKLVFDATLGRGVMGRAARVLAVTQSERRQLVGIGVDDGAIRVVGNPIDLGEFEPPPARGRFRERHGLGERPVVMFLGKLTPRKRVDVLVEAFASLGRAEAALVIAGNDLGAGRRLRWLVRHHGLEAHTLFTGLLPGRRRVEALADADVVVYPSRDEAFGLVPVESLLVGTPVIVADDAGCGEVIGRVGGGRVVRQGDVGEVARAIQGMLDQPRRWREIAAEAGGRVRELFGADSVLSAIEQVYDEVA
jgi:glycosyltransferase involved in cell wall biosynthesis